MIIFRVEFLIMEKLQMEYRQMDRDEFNKFNELDRREVIEQIYYYRNGDLELVKEYWNVPEWRPDQKREKIDKLYQLDNKGGMVYGAFDGSLLVGMITLDREFIGSNKDLLNLSGLWVSQNYRKQGIAGKLVDIVKIQAKELGAKKLYVSATPSYNTVQFYMKRGFELAKEINPVLFEMEPEDIHMEMKL